MFTVLALVGVFSSCPLNVNFGHFYYKAIDFFSLKAYKCEEKKVWPWLPPCNANTFAFSPMQMFINDVIFKDASSKVHASISKTFPGEENCLLSTKSWRHLQTVMLTFYNVNAYVGHGPGSLFKEPEMSWTSRVEFNLYPTYKYYTVKWLKTMQIN